MTSKESCWAEFDRQCDEWIARAMDSELMSVLRNLQELEPDRGSENLHFFCSFLLNNDVDHMTVATLSGHKSLKVLKDRYGHYDDQTLERAMSVFDRILGLDSRKSPAVQK